MRTRLAAAAVAAALLAAAPPAVRGGGAVYTFTDSQGIVHFTNVPSDPRYTAAAAEPAPPAGGKAVPESRFSSTIRECAVRHGVDPSLVTAVVKAESNFDHRAISRAGAQGLMQLMPETARRERVHNPFDPEQNLEGGTRHLKHLLDTFQDTRLALAAYNAGENAVKQHNGIPPYPETRNYVRTVMSYYRELGSSVAETDSGGIHTFTTGDGVRVFTNLPWKYRSAEGTAGGSP